ncbi:MAG: SPASM domain-containing protein [Ignavibacteriales bacterium]|nr:SPASM domain-containing protein [Ignavibacteriales bacterium]
MQINPFKHFTFLRGVNIIKIFFSYFLSIFLKRPIVWGKPITTTVEPTNLCNLKCPECPRGISALTRNAGYLSLEDFKKIVDQIYKYTFYIQLFFQGEPFLNKDLFKMIDYAKSKKMFVSISTNGTLFSDEMVNKLFESPPNKLIFSLDGLDEATYKIYRRGGIFNETLNGLGTISKYKKNKKLKEPFIELQFLVMKHNEHQIPLLNNFIKKYSVDKLKIKTMQVYSLEGAKNFLPSNPKYSRYILSENEFRIKSKLPNRCFTLWKNILVTWDGRVVPCCFDKDATYEMGNINKEEIISIWKNKKYLNFRKSILRNRKNISICNNCTSGLRIK